MWIGATRLAIVVMLALAACGCGRAPAPETESQSPAVGSQQRIVNFFNWSDFIDPSVPQSFTRETGIRVNYGTFDNEAMLETKLLTGKSGYDVVVVAANVLGRLIQAGVFQKLDPALLPNRRNLDPELLALLARDDPGNQFAIGYMWGTTGIGYDAKRIKALAPGAPTDSWRLVYDPKFAARLAPCGISIIDVPEEVIATAVMSAGGDPNAVGTAELATAERLLQRLRPYVRKVDNDSQIDELAGGEACLMVTGSSNVVIARRRAREAHVDADLRYVIPKEGTISWFDTLAIPADAPHPREAHAFINYLMRADVAARNTNHVGDPSANKAAMPLVEEAIRSDHSIYPPAEVLARLKPLAPRTLEQSRAENRIWTRFKTGQ